MIIDLFLGISRSNWRAGTTWTSRKKGLCVFCLHVSRIFLLVYDLVLLCMCASLHLCDRFRLKFLFFFIFNCVLQGHLGKPGKEGKEGLKGTKVRNKKHSP